MKKFFKFIAILAAVAAAVAAAYYILKKLGFFKGCNLDCDNCDCDCACKNDEEDEDDEEESFDSREYVSIQPKSEDVRKEASESDDNAKAPSAESNAE